MNTDKIYLNIFIYLKFSSLRLEALDLLHFPLLGPALLRQLGDHFLSELTEIRIRVLVTGNIHRWQIRPVSISPGQLLYFRLKQRYFCLVCHFSHLEYYQHYQIIMRIYKMRLTASLSFSVVRFVAFSVSWASWLEMLTFSLKFKSLQYFPN